MTFGSRAANFYLPGKRRIYNVDWSYSFIKNLHLFKCSLSCLSTLTEQAIHRNFYIILKKIAKKICETDRLHIYLQPVGSYFGKFADKFGLQRMIYFDPKYKGQAKKQKRTNG
jgi:hypothetical protein